MRRKFLWRVFGFLLHEALQYGVRVRVYYVKTAFQPQFELDDAKRLVQELNADMRILHLDILRDDTITENPSNRCYLCCGASQDASPSG